jgi:hypothetical protein
MIQIQYRNFPWGVQASVAIDGLDGLVGGGLDENVGCTFDATVVVAFEIVVASSFAVAVLRLLGDVLNGRMREDTAALSWPGRNQRNQASVDTLYAQAAAVGCPV